MKIDRDLVRRVARLAALDLAEGEDARLAEELTRVVDHFEALRRVPDELLPPLPAPPPSPLREDLPAGEPGERPFVGGNAPEFGHGHFVVPRVVSRKG
ncbi:MAG: Asp-tRNA(Asn)/Glu-tRNA(Gln) amidotransferase subunit GatC [Holophagales bacterium]|nr:Asp-tRNA(Asn)/Glu-tRNA(Gln) amidotransferase subunit GatC [Holophagales bacterium]